MSLIKGRLRMTDWLLQGILWLTLNKLPSLVPVTAGFISVEFQAVAWRFGVLTLSAYLGFLLDRALFGELNHETHTPQRALCRALTVGSFLLASAVVV